MKKEKMDRYHLTGSVHTVEIRFPKTQGLSKGDGACIDVSVNQKEEAKAVINANKLNGDIFGYTDFGKAFNQILKNNNIGDYWVSRADFRLDSYRRADYKDFAKLHKYMICAIAIGCNARNCYNTRNLWTNEQLSIAVKTGHFQIENYDKYVESNGTDIAMARLEERSMNSNGLDIKRAFLHEWFDRWDKAISNLDKVQERYNAALMDIWEQDRESKPRKFLSLREFIMSYQDCIFTRKQLIDLVTATGESKNPESWAKTYVNRYGIEFISKNNVKTAVKEIRRATKEFFQK